MNVDLQLVTALIGARPDEATRPDERGSFVVIAQSDEGREIALALNLN